MIGIRKRTSYPNSIVALFGALFVIVSAVVAEPSPEINETAQHISETTMSPFCPGRTLSACPSEQARDLRVKVHNWLEQGYTEQGVRNQLLTIYGEDVRGTPRAEGFGILGWYAPAIFALFCLFAVILGLKRLKDNAREVNASSHKRSDSALIQRVESELKTFLK